MEKQFTSIREFYPYYLSEHQHPTSRILHFIGTGLVILILVVSLSIQKYSWMATIPFVGYGFAWIGHFFFEKNKPATFKYPFYSLGSDFILFFDLLTGKQKFSQNK